MGATFTSLYRGGGYEVLIKWTVKDVCSGEGETCEYQGRTAVIEVRHGGLKTRARGTGGTGGCGC